jgi:hypothetical protein
MPSTISGASRLAVEQSNGMRGGSLGAPRPPSQPGHRFREADSAEGERRRLVDHYQAGLIELVELQRRAKDLDHRRRDIEAQRQALSAQQDELANGNPLRQRIGGFAARVTTGIDGLDSDQRQKLLRLLVEELRVTGWNVEICLRIPLDEPPDGDKTPPSPHGRASRPSSVKQRRFAFHWS